MFQAWIVLEEFGGKIGDGRLAEAFSKFESVDNGLTAKVVIGHHEDRVIRRLESLDTFYPGRQFVGLIEVIVFFISAGLARKPLLGIAAVESDIGCAVQGERCPDHGCGRRWMIDVGHMPAHVVEAIEMVEPGAVSDFQKKRYGMEVVRELGHMISVNRASVVVSWELDEKSSQLARFGDGTDSFEEGADMSSGGTFAFYLVGESGPHLECETKGGVIADQFGPSFNMPRVWDPIEAGVDFD
jgi:hypothetical protein